MARTNENKAETFDGAIDASPWVVKTENGWHFDLIVPGINCAGCIRAIEDVLRSQAGVTAARVNFSTRRVAVDWQGKRADGSRLVHAVEALGYRVQPFDAETLAAAKDDPEGRALLRAMAVAGFATGNIMLLSVSVWSGAEFATRELFHWLSALIALPAVVYSGRPFFRSALGALTHRRLNMDVPISLAILLAAAVSLFETMNAGRHAYFDASVMLVFFLLVGRYLDHLTRSRARGAAADLLALAATAATIFDEAGGRKCVRTSELKPGHVLAVAPGERIAADGKVVAGRSDLDRSMVTGETVPEAVEPGVRVHAGTLNLSGALRVEVTATGEDTLLAEIVRLMEVAEQGRGAQVRLADRAARIYSPAVHILALITFIGWIYATGDPRQSILIAVSVLIITCPCALGLAVPAVQVAAAGTLMRLGVLVKHGEALEALAGADTVVFDKTGTLTLGKPRLARDADSDGLALAAALAVESRHPLAQALVVAARKNGLDIASAEEVMEHPGQGLSGRISGRGVRLGNRKFIQLEANRDEDDGLSELWLSVEGGPPRRFAFEDAPRQDADEVVAALKARGLQTRLLSGDRRVVVARLARELGFEDHAAGATPDVKLASVEALRAAGANVLMVGDGLNDAPALAAANVSMSPSSAADISQTSAGFVYLGERLWPIVETLDIARRADRLVRQNFAIAIGYNLVAVPIAMAGFASPLLAAVAMSTSSIVVTANALRVAWVAPRARKKAQETTLPLTGRPVPPHGDAVA
ncbi:Type cbb3 cytochrome oxidase biogenesis protein CcoI; Copper-translocating P-type ATPase [hydrothermal vent metagenome]|uniref:Type cbb3 cytochrome oxidase biogenesis protein CcoI Copper-translocating P-type ATPase n=1 Tax=hydrothermal vent metagenome TaxID=652676 RepID=A0A3B0TYZ6_9ZZZZ